MAFDASDGTEVLTLDVCRSTLAHIRHDWSLIFPLKNDVLMLVWCEYYTTQPSRVLREPYEPMVSCDWYPCRISGKLSTDKGRTWSGTITLQDNVDALNVKHPNLLRLASNPDEILFIYTVRYAEEKEIRILMKRSNDECESWGPSEQISSLPGIHYLAADRILQLDSGRIILPVFQSDSWIPFDAFCYYSDDDGRTWQTSKTRMKLPDHGAQAPSIVVSKDGSLLALLRTSLGTLFKSHSHDGGENWAEPVSTGLPAPACSPLLKRIPTTGDLLLIWNSVYDPDHPDFQNGHGPRDPLTMAISRDGGDTWENVKDIESRPGGVSSAPAVTFVGDEALLTYYTQGLRMPEHEKFEIRLKIIPVAWLYQ